MKRLVLSLIILTLLCTGCAGLSVTPTSAQVELNDTVAMLQKDSGNRAALDRKTVGARGYFYIIKTDGTVAYHPKKKLINLNFGQYQFVRKILERRNGCLSYNIDGVNRYIFFREIDRGSILCLAIESDEFSEPVPDCTAG